MARLYNVPTADFTQKVLGAALLQGVVAAATLNNTTSIPNLQGVMMIDRVDSNGVETPNKVEVISFTGTSGATVTTLVRGLAGTSDQDHAISAIVEFGPDILWAQAILDALGTLVDVSTGLPNIKNPKFTLGSDATGDIFFRGAGGTLSRLALGSVNQVLTANASLPFWSTPSAAGASLSRTPFQTITDASTMYIDFSLGTKFMATVVPSGARTFLATNATLGDIAMLRLLYASTASFSLNLLFGAGATISWGGGSNPVPTSTVNKADIFGFEMNGTLPKFDGVIISQNL